MIMEIQPEIEKRLYRLSEVTKQPPATLVNKVLLDYLEDWEDYTDAVAVCEEVDAGRMKVYSMQEVEKELDELNAMGN